MATGGTPDAFPTVVRCTRLRRPSSRGLAIAASMVLLSAAGSGCGGRDGAGVIAAGTLPAGSPPDAALLPGDPVVSSTTEPPSPSPADVAPSTTAPAPPPATAATSVAPPPPRPPVPLPSDPDAVVLRLTWLGGYPLPGGELLSQPIELRAGGGLVRPVSSAPTDPAPAHHRLEASEVSLAEVEALVAAAEDAGATAPPADLGYDPDLADGGVLVLHVDRPGLRSDLVVRDPYPGSSDARGLTPDQMSRRRAVLDLVDRLQATGRDSGPLHDDVRVVALLPRTGSGTTATTRASTDLRTWTGPALHMGTLSGCVDVPFAEMDRQVPGWTSATTATQWRSGSDVLTMAFLDARSPTARCSGP